MITRTNGAGNHGKITETLIFKGDTLFVLFVTQINNGSL